MLRSFDNKLEEDLNFSLRSQVLLCLFIVIFKYI